MTKQLQKQTNMETTGIPPQAYLIEKNGVAYGHLEMSWLRWKLEHS